MAKSMLETKCVGDRSKILVTDKLSHEAVSGADGA